MNIDISQIRDDSMANKFGRIAYITQTFPDLTITFIYREIFALKLRGFNIATFAIWKPAKDKISLESRDLVDTTHYVFPVSWARFFLTHLYFLSTGPIKYLSTAVFALSRRGESFKNRLRTAFHFGEALYLAKEMKRQGIRHIHAHFSINAATIALVISRVLGISFSFTAHNNLFTDRLILKEKIREALFIVAISRFTRKFLIDIVPKEDFKDKIHVIHCGLSPSEFLPANPKSANDVPMILFVAQLEERKGASILIETCKILAQRRQAFRCVIIGDGPERAIVERNVQRYALQDIVELKGPIFQEHLKEYLNQADIFVLPCLTAENGDMDGIPVSLMEAMAMEIPSVSTFISGVPELIEDGKSGMLVGEKDAVALADALQQLLEDEGLRKRLGRNGRLKILREFDIDKNVYQLAALFKKYVTDDE